MRCVVCGRRMQRKKPLAIGEELICAKCQREEMLANTLGRRVVYLPPQAVTKRVAYLQLLKATRERAELDGKLSDFEKAWLQRGLSATLLRMLLQYYTQSVARGQAQRLPSDELLL